jgi:hypothetical protein
MPTVISATVSAEHTLKHLHETTKGFLVTKPSTLLDTHYAGGIYFETKIFVPNTRGSTLRM